MMSDCESKATNETCSDILSGYKLESATYTGSYGTCGEWWGPDLPQAPGGEGVFGGVPWGSAPIIIILSVNRLPMIFNFFFAGSAMRKGGGHFWDRTFCCFVVCSRLYVPLLCNVQCAWYCISALCLWLIILHNMVHVLSCTCTHGTVMIFVSACNIEKLVVSLRMRLYYIIIILTALW